jgi:hypothetical protein
MATTIIKQAKLFGIEHSNRNFSKKESWGKNQFNSSFPVALACYISDKNLENVYLKLDKNLKVIHANITSESLFRITRKISHISKSLFRCICVEQFGFYSLICHYRTHYSNKPSNKNNYLACQNVV